MKKRTHYAVILATLLSSITSGYSIAKNDDKLDISGYFMLDHDSFDSAFLENSDDSQSLTDVRRARLSVKSTINDDWQAKLQLGFAQDNIDIKDAYIQYRGWSWADLTLGHQKESFGLEKLTSSRNLLMIERSMISEAFAPGRSVGVNFSGELSSLYWQLGYYQPAQEETSAAVTGRLVWVPWQQDDNLLHLGFSFSERDYQGNEFRLNEKLEVYSSDSLLESDKLLADTVSLQGLEFLWLKDQFTVMAEWQHASILVADSTQENHDYQGGYLQVSYQLSGGHRHYKNSVLSSHSQNGWELTSRYSEFSLLDEEARIYSIGINYTVNKRLKFMANYIKSERFENDQRIDLGNAVSLRAQYSF